MHRDTSNLTPQQLADLERREQLREQLRKIYQSLRCEPEPEPVAPWKNRKARRREAALRRRR